METTGVFRLSMIALSVTMGLALVVAVRRARPSAAPAVLAGLTVWMAVTGGLAAGGLLGFESRPPTMLVMLLFAVGGTAWLAFSAVGTALVSRVHVGWLVGFQVFRVPVELWLHRGYAEGAFPVQMTYAGLNFDIVSGVTAAAVGWLVWKGYAGRRLVLGWNILGVALLLNIVVIALLSAPLPIRTFTTEPANVFVTTFPGIWLPAVLVQAALLGHLLVFRWLRSERRGETG